MPVLIGGILDYEKKEKIGYGYNVNDKFWF